MIAYVICMNDAIEGVVVNDEKQAKKKMEELCKQYYESMRKSMQGSLWLSYDEYKDQCYLVITRIIEEEAKEQP